MPWQSIVIGVEADFYGQLRLDRSGVETSDASAFF